MTHNYQTAPMAKRVTAFIIDMIIVGMVTSAFLFVSMGKTPEKLQANPLTTKERNWLLVQLDKR